jgi:hypothetical protein
MDLIQGLAAASAAIGIAKDLREIDRSVDEASYKLKIAELISALADTKIALADAKEKIMPIEAELVCATSGDICPLCKIGRLKVQSVTPHDRVGSVEFHTSKCDHDDCSYSSQRQYDTNRGIYSSKRE